MAGADTKALTTLIQSHAGLSTVPATIILGDGKFTLAPTSPNATALITEAAIKKTFAGAGFLVPGGSIALSATWLGTLSDRDTKESGRLVWAVINVGASGQMGAAGPAANGVNAGPPADNATTNVIAFYDALTGAFVSAIQETS